MVNLPDQNLPLKKRKLSLLVHSFISQYKFNYIVRKIDLIVPYLRTCPTIFPESGLKD